MGAKTHWTCSKYRDKAIQCMARAVTNNEENVIITLTGKHTIHRSELMTIKAKMIVNEAVSHCTENLNVGPRRYLWEIQNKVDETNWYISNCIIRVKIFRFEFDHLHEPTRCNINCTFTEIWFTIKGNV